MFRIEGVDELMKNFDKLADAAGELDGTNDVTIDQLLTPEFVSRHTRFSTREVPRTSGGEFVRL